MTRWCRTIVAAVAVLAGATAAVAGNSSIPDPRICGDVNNNGAVATSDALLLLRQSVGQPVTPACSANSAQHFGFTGDIPEISNFSPNYLLGVAVTIPGPTVVTHLGVIGLKEGPPFKLALYKDSGGDPDSLVVGSETGNLVVGPQAIAVNPTFIPGGTYWVMSIFETTGDLPGNNLLANNVVKYRAQSFSDPFPASFGPNVSYVGGPLHHYVKAITVIPEL